MYYCCYYYYYYYLCKNSYILECGPMPDVMAALPNVGGALCSTQQRLDDAHYYSAKTLPRRETR